MMTRYEHVARELRNLIRSGEWTAGERIPTEPELCERFHVSRTTIRQAVQILSGEGLLICRQGLGTFVLNPETSRKPISLSDFSSQVQKGQLHIERKLISNQVILASEEQGRDLRVPPGTPLRFFQRLDSMDNQPVSIDECLIPEKYTDHLEERDFADPLFFYRWIEKQAIKIIRNEQSISTEPARSEDCRYLKVGEDIWMLVLTETFFDSDGEIVGRIVTRYRGDSSRLTTSIYEPLKR